MEMKIQTKPSLSMNIVNAETGIGMNVDTGGGSSSKQVYRGPDYPTSDKILIWIDTSGSTPSTDIQFITKDNKEFITANNEKFILREEN